MNFHSGVLIERDMCWKFGSLWTRVRAEGSKVIYYRGAIDRKLQSTCLFPRYSGCCVFSPSILSALHMVSSGLSLEYSFEKKKNYKDISFLFPKSIYLNSFGISCLATLEHCIFRNLLVLKKIWFFSVLNNSIQNNQKIPTLKCYILFYTALHNIMVVFTEIS